MTIKCDNALIQIVNALQNKYFYLKPHKEKTLVKDRV